MVIKAEIPKGYKQTEAGLIPEDWEVKRLGELFEITSSKRVFQSEWRTEGIPFYRARELAVLGETGHINNDLFISEEMYKSYRNTYGVPEKGDMLVTGVGTLGKTYVVSGDHEFYFKDGNIIWFKISGKVDADFLKQLYLTKLITKQIEDGSAGTTVGTYTITGAKKTLIPFPDLNEQHAIAEALSDVDGLITSLDELISKKRQIKQGTMQQLLTGKKRLPGFSGDWEEKKLGEIGEFKNGINKAKEDFGFGQPFVNLLDVFGVPQLFLNSKLGLINSSISERNMYNLLKGDVLFVRSSVKPEGVGLTSLVATNLKDTVYSGFLIRFRDHGKLDFGYKIHCFNEEMFRKNVVNNSTVSANTNINQNSLKELLIKIPPTQEEQRAIAQVLSDMDNEITSLEQKGDKYKSIKQGMMQELLTGKTRLV